MNELKENEIEVISDEKSLRTSTLTTAQVYKEFSNQIAGQRLKDVIQNYIEYYATGTGHTAKAKRYDLKYFLEYLAQQIGSIEKVFISDWTMQVTNDYIDYRLSLGESPSTLNRRLATIKHFGRTLAERVPGFINPAREVKNPKIQNSRPKGLGENEIALLKKAAEKSLKKDPDSFNLKRNKFLLNLLLATGLRADEVRLLVISQIDENLSWLKNVKTKGKKFRNVYLDSEIRDELAEYIKARGEYLNQKFPVVSDLSKQEFSRIPLLISSYNADTSIPNSFGLSAKTIWRIISNFGKKAISLSEDKKVPNLHPHLLRHTFAHGLLDSSKDVRLVAQALGHSDVRITMRYTERTEEELAKAIEQKNSKRN